MPPLASPAIDETRRGNESEESDGENAGSQLSPAPRPRRRGRWLLRRWRHFGRRHLLGTSVNL